MNLEFTSEQTRLRDHFCDFGRRVIAPRADERDERGLFDRSLWEQLAKEGLWGLHVPSRYGGAGGTMWDFVAAFEGLAAGARDSGFVLSGIAHAGLVQVLLDHGTEEQRARWLPRLVGGALGATAATERGGGSHVSDIRTSAVVVEGGYLVTGEKVHITNAPLADLVLVVGRIPALGRRDITLFVLETDAPGVKRGAVEDLVGQRSSPTGAVVLNAAYVPADAVVGPPGNGLETLYSFLAFDRLMYGIAVAGLLEDVIDHALTRSKERVSFGVPIADHQYVQDKIVRMKLTMETSRWLAYSAVAALARGNDACSIRASLTKLAASEGMVASALEYIQLFGHLGYDRTTGIERVLRDAVGLRLVGGSTEMQKLNIFKQLSRPSGDGASRPSNDRASTVARQQSPIVSGPIRARRRLVVERRDCADAWGNPGSMAFSTPAMLGRMEELCVRALAPHLPAGSMSVGTAVSLKHLAPTPAGKEVDIEVRLTDVRSRRLTFEFVVTDAKEKVGEGTHERSVVGSDKFESLLAAKQ